MNSLRVLSEHRLDAVKGIRQSRGHSRGPSLGHSEAGFIKATLVLVVAIALGLTGTGGTYAYLNAAATATPGSTVSAGTAALTVGSQSLSWANMAPGGSRTGTFTITNTGDVPLILSAAIAATMTPSSVSNPFTISVANGSCPASGVPAGTLNGTLAAGATTSACIVVTLPASAPSSAQSASAAIAATINGVQP